MKYCVIAEINGKKEKVSRFFNTKHQANLRKRSGEEVVSKKYCIENFIYTEPPRNPILKHIDISMVPGMSFPHTEDSYQQSIYNKENWKRYIDFCKQNGYIGVVENS